MIDAPIMKFLREHGRLPSLWKQMTGFTLLICGLLLFPTASAYAASSSQWEIPVAMEIGHPLARSLRILLKMPESLIFLVIEMGARSPTPTSMPFCCVPGRDQLWIT